MKVRWLIAASVLALSAFLSLGQAAPPRADDVPSEALERADRLLLTGRYEEAYEEYASIGNEDARAVVGRSRCRASVGRRDEAARILDQALRDRPEAAAPAAELALLTLDQGRHERARELAQQALGADDANADALWVLAEVDRLRGKLEEAERTYERIARLELPRQGYRAAETIRRIGLASARLARWSGDGERFDRLVNRTFPAALDRDDRYWPAHLEAARLFAEKYNEAQAIDELNRALAINAQAAEAHAVRAAVALNRFDLPTARRAVERALEIDPALLEALLVQADLHVARRRLDEAGRTLEQALSLNPHDEETLGRLAAVRRLRGGPDEGETRRRELERQVRQRNPRCGWFHASMADTFDRVQRFPLAADAYRDSIRALPRTVGVRGKLGLTLMRLGQEREAAELLRESFKADPFNVRVKNMLAVLDVLRDYAVVETDHFVIKFDRGRDEMLARCAADYLEEEVYPSLVETLGYEPADKSLIEIFSRSGSTSGHGWFSARMVGLPFIGTVGACAGKMVAITSPNDMPQPYNWARVLKHEFVHVVNLQQTGFNCPRWFTEGLAVWHEGYPRPAKWNTVLAGRAKEGTLFDLDSIDYGFARPADADDWALAYCQAELYVEYLSKRFGDDAISGLLAGYARDLTTREALADCLDVEQEEFEEGYREHVGRAVADLPAPTNEQLGFARLQRAAQQQPDDPDRLADLAHAHLRRGSAPEARKLALAARRLRPNHPLAGYVLARLYLSIGDGETARRLLRDALDENDPHQHVLGLLAGMHYKAGEFDEAARLYEIGRRTSPNRQEWLQALARTYLKAGDDAALRKVLERLAELDDDAAAVSKKLCQLAAQADDHEAAVKWAKRALHVEVNDARTHAWLARSLAALGNQDGAIRYYRYAIRLQPENSDWRLALADTCAKAGRPDDARDALRELLRRDPDHADGALMLEKLDR